MDNKKNNKGILIAIIALVCCVLALLGTAVVLALSGADDSTPTKSNSEMEWTSNY